MKIVIPGGSGQIGTILARSFHADGHDVIILSRSPGPANVPWKTILWDAKTLGEWTETINGADVVINLAGRSVNCRYHQKNRDAIMNSRVDSTRVVAKAIAQAKQPPHTWLQASTATIYAHRYDAPNDELTGIIGGNEPDAPDTWRFSINVAKAWEAAAQETPLPNTRLVLMRSAMTMSPDRGGVFDTLLNLTRLGIGGTIADGKQYMSWIHEHDFIESIKLLIKDKTLKGTINIASPNPIPQSEFMQLLRQASHTRIGLPATKWMIEIGTFFMRTESELVLKSRRVIPTHLTNAGLAFQYPHWKEAVKDLCERSHRT